MMLPPMSTLPRRLPPARLVPALLLVIVATLPAPLARAGDRVDRLLERMTLEEKLGQLSQTTMSASPPTGPEKEAEFADELELVRSGRVGSLLAVHGASHTNAIQRVAVEESRLGIPVLFANDVIHGYRTTFPVPIAEAATWRPGLVERNARIAATEARAGGTHWTYAPMIDVTRDPRWGRIVETSGEDPYLGAVMGAARVRGFQGDDLTAPDAVLSCAKHFVAYGAPEGGRDYGTVDISLETLHEIHLRPFRAAARAGVGSMMTAFNEINGVPATGNLYTMRRLLRDGWGWDGLVVSDWESVEEMEIHGYAADLRDAARLGLLAGTDIEMVSTTYRTHGASLVADGELDEAVIDESVRRVLLAKERLGLLDDPYTDETLADRVTLTPEHLSHAREAARRSFVLLENGRDGAPGPLPLTGGVRRIALVGPLADHTQACLGTWASVGRDEDVVTILAALEAEPGLAVDHAPGSGVLEPIDGGLDAVRAAVTGADAVIAVVGETPDLNGEAHSRADITIPAAQLEALRVARAAADEAGAPLVVLLFTGRPLVMPWVVEHADALMVVWHPGVQAGPAVADVLLGRAEPSGRLPVSFPRHVGQIPVHYAHKTTGRPFEYDDPTKRHMNRYVDVPNEPRYPFGYGLSYTGFEFGPVEVAEAQVPTDGAITATMRVTNTGARAGGTVAQLYFHDPAASRTRPVRQLVRFEAVDLAPGETREVRWTIPVDDLAFYVSTPGGPDEGWVVEPGEIVFFGGGDSTAAAGVSIELTGPRRAGLEAPGP
jgi:beta-glucosidase